MNPSLSYINPYTRSPNIPENAEQDKVTYSQFPSNLRGTSGKCDALAMCQTLAMADGMAGKVPTGMDSMYLELLIF